MCGWVGGGDLNLSLNLQIEQIELKVIICCPIYHSSEGMSLVLVSVWDSWVSVVVHIIKKKQDFHLVFYINLINCSHQFIFCLVIRPVMGYGIQLALVRDCAGRKCILYGTFNNYLP